MKKIYLVLFAFGFFQAQSQELVQSSLILSWTAQEITDNLDLIGNNMSPAIYDVDVYKVWYTTNDIKGNLDTASGIIAIPDVAGAVPFIAYQHGTSDRESVPSGLGSGSSEALFFAGNGYFTVAADYIGMGESRGLHPYIHADSEAWAGADLMSSAVVFAENEDILLTDQIFITGYSQGGHASMALYKLLQENYKNEFPVTAASPMSGPYNVSGIMLDRILSDEPYIPGTAFLPYVVMGLQQAYGNLYNDLEDIFKPTYASDMEDFEATGEGLGSMAQALSLKLIVFNGFIQPKVMLQDSILQIITDRDPNHPLITALLQNDLYGWIPESPMRLFYCEADEQVPYTNSPFTDSVMTENGAMDVISMSQGESLDHGGCASPALEGTLQFFNGFLPVGVSDISSSSTLSLTPNPATDKLIYTSNDAKILEIETFFMNGYTLKNSGEINQMQYTLDLSDVSDGSYFSVIHLSDGIQVKKFVVIKK